MGALGEVFEITSSTTYSGNGSLFWIYIHATADTTVTVADDTDEKISLYQAADTSGPITVFTPAIRVKTSLKVTISGTAKVSLCHNVS